MKLTDSQNRGQFAGTICAYDLPTKSGRVECSRVSTYEQSKHQVKGSLLSEFGQDLAQSARNIAFANLTFIKLSNCLLSIFVIDESKGPYYRYERVPPGSL